MKNQLTIEQRQDLLQQLDWDSEEFDIEVLDGPHPDSPGRWRVRVTLGKRKVVLYQPVRGHIKMDARSVIRSEGRPSTKSSDINRAIRRAQSFLLQLRVKTHSGAAEALRLQELSEDEVTTGLIHDWFRKDALGSFEHKFQFNLTLVMDLVEAFSGRTADPLKIDEDWIVDFIKWRTAKPVRLRRRYPDKSEEIVILQPVEPVTALSNIKDYDRILQFAYRLRRGPQKERLIPANPLREITNWPKHEKALRERASDQLYELLMVPTVLQDDAGTRVVLPAPVDQCDPTGLGILRTIVAVKYHTARRREAVLGLRCGDVLTEPAELRRALRSLGGAHRAEWAQHFEHGGLLFRGELDKNNYSRLFPMSEALRAHIDAHLSRLREAGGSTGPEALLFPSEKDPGKPVSDNLYRVRSVVRYQLASGEWVDRPRKGGWYTEALYLAREYLGRIGIDPEAVVPTDPERPGHILPGFKAHAWRRWWATKLERLGYGKKTSSDEFDLDRHVNFMGSWTILGGGIREERYVELDARVLMAVARFEDGTRFLKERAHFEEKSTVELLKRVTKAAPGEPCISSKDSA